MVGPPDSKEVGHLLPEGRLKLVPTVSGDGGGNSKACYPPEHKGSGDGLSCDVDYMGIASGQRVKRSAKINR